MGRKRKNRGKIIVNHQKHHPTIEDPLTIKSSWFGNEIKWVSRHDDIHNSTSIQDSRLCCCNSVDGSDNGSDNGGISNANGMAKGSATHQSLMTELNQLKQQFMPAAQSCADAINHYNNISSTTATASTKNKSKKNVTTPQYEFRKARSLCNPHERLGDISIRPHRYNNNTSKKHQRRNDGKKSSSTSFQFVNRSAIKLANIDALLGFPLTRLSKSFMAVEKPSSSTVRDDDHDEAYFAFVDLCGAPGGFTEYILYRHMNPLNHDDDDDDDDDDTSEQKRADNSDSHSTFRFGTNNDGCDSSKTPCYGFGMSLSGRNDEGKGVRWDLNHLKKHYQLQINQDLSTDNNDVTIKDSQVTQSNNEHGNNEQLLHYHICRGVDGTGSIYNWENVEELQRQVTMHLPRQNDGNDTNNNSEMKELTQQQRRRVHLVVADGGFDAQRDSNNQEVLAHHIVVSQTAAALTLLRKGGTYIVKMFGFQEESTKQMLRHLYGCFDKMTFVKPTSSRPASAERYLVCCGYAGAGSSWDGLAWKQQQMDISSTTLENMAYDCIPLDNLADEFDLDMLKLNVESCRSIVDYLQENRDSV